MPTVDKMALLARVGGECAGAVQFLPAGVPPGPGEVMPLAASEVEDMVASLPTYRWPDGSPPQASLAGIQDKLLLTCLGDGWGWPTGGASRPLPVAAGAEPPPVDVARALVS